MTEVLQDYEQKPAGRPTFLTVLCILTFIGSGWGLISAGITYFSAKVQAENMQTVRKQASSDMDKQPKNDKGSKIAERMVGSLTTAFTEENLKKASIAQVLGALFCIAGAFMMWKLNKTGFYLYIAGTLIGIISPFVIYGTGNFMSIISSVMTGFIGIIFIILYGVNVKHMR